MEGVRTALACTGYGTEKWERFRAVDPGVAGRAIDGILEELDASAGESPESPASEPGESVTAAGAVAGASEAPGEQPADTAGEDDAQPVPANGDTGVSDGPEAIRELQTALMYEVGQRVSSELRKDALLSEIVRAVRDAFGALD